MDEESRKAIREELAEARRILREDLVLSKLNKHFPDEPAGDESPDDGKPKPPAKKDPLDKPEPKRDSWWGDALNDL